MSEERIAKLEAQIESLKKVISTVGENAQKSVTDVREELGRVNRVQIDRTTKVEGIALEAGDKINSLEKMIIGDGDQDPGIRAQLKEAMADTSELKLDKRDRKTRTGLFTTAWSFGGAIALGLIISAFKGIIDEKAQNALRVQNGNEQEFATIKAKADKNNQTFFDSISSLNVHRGKVESDLEWIKNKVK
jgi:regulator of replication initiation timing